MTMSEYIPTASERIAERVRALRTKGEWDQATVAEILTALGSPAGPSTIARIERGDQPLSVDQLLLLALFAGPDGLRSLLVPPFTIGEITVRDEHDLEHLIGGRSAGAYVDDDGVRLAANISTPLAERVTPAYEARRHRMIAETLRTSERKVSNASQRLYGRGADAEIRARFSERLRELDPAPERDSAQYRVYRSHAVRAVTKEIGEALR